MVTWHEFKGYRYCRRGERFVIYTPEGLFLCMVCADGDELFKEIERDLKRPPIKAPFPVQQVLL
jgi:hypothetical protein